MNLWVVKVVVANCGCDLRVNDVPVFEDHGRSGRVELERFVSLLVGTGQNVLSFALRPRRVEQEEDETFLDQPEVFVEMQLIRRLSVRGADEVLGTLRFRGIGLRGDDPRSSVDYAGASEGGVVEAEVDRVLAWCRLDIEDVLPAWSWVSAEQLTVSDEVRAAVEDLYGEVRVALERRDLAALRAAMEENAREAALGFGCSMDEAYAILGLERIASDARVDLLPPQSDVRLELFGYGRLARLVDAQGASALAVRDTRRSLRTHIDLFVARLPGRGWIAVR